MVVDVNYILFSFFIMFTYVFLYFRLRLRQKAIPPAERKPFRGLHAIVAAVVLITLILGGFLVRNELEKEKEEFRKTAKGIVTTLSYELEREGHWQISRNTRPDDPHYLYLITQMKNWMWLNAQINSVYTLRKTEDGSQYFVLAPETDYNHDGVIKGSLEQRLPIGFAYSHMLVEMQQAYRGNVTVEARPTSDEWGYSISAFAPMYDAHGNVEAILGVDFDGKGWEQKITGVRMRVYGFLFTPFVLILSFYWLIYRYKLEKVQLTHMAHHDLLTGLPNRTLFYQRFRGALAKVRQQPGTKVAVMILDGDRFKYINDMFGHGAGDQFIQKIAERLSECVGEQGTVCRMGGDEFTILLPEVETAAEVERTAKSILRHVSRPMCVSGHELIPTVSIGISSFPDDGTSMEELLKSADIAMYQAKEQGGNAFRFYTPDMDKLNAEKLLLESQLHKALERQEFQLFYQPQFEIGTGRLIGMEALIRWKHPEMGWISPAEFIPVAERSGLIIPISEWVLRTACEQNKRWQDAGFPPLRVAVNLSSRQFQQEGLVSQVAAVLQQTGLAPRYLELEITEGMAMQNSDWVISLLRDLCNLGIELSIDDFGTGYSSLSYLKRFPLHRLKIDHSFIRDVLVDPNDAAIVTAIIQMAKSLGLKVIAEGVELEEQLAFLRERGCDEVQGYLFSRPLSAPEFEIFLQRHLSAIHS